MEIICGSLLVECLHADLAAPRSFWGNLHGWYQAVHVVAPVAVVAEEELVVVFTRPAESAGLALDALPGVLPDGDHHHVPGELETSRVARSATLRATNQLLRLH